MEQGRSSSPRLLEEGEVQYSVVVPFYNEEEAVGALIQEICVAMAAISERFEVVAVDDCSKDRTAEILHKASEEDPRVRVFRFRKNSGQAAALYSGMFAAQGAVLITMDGDGQNDPADIPRLLAHLDEADMVVGIRANRQDSMLRRWMSRLANRVRGQILRDRMRDSGCALKVFRREVVTAFIPVRTLYSYMPALAVGSGFSLAQVEVRHRARQGGTSSYGLRAFLWRPLLDLLGIWWYTHRCFTPEPLTDSGALEEGESRAAIRA